jgi:protocatechuate 3,4-dioxygenase beta subunit
VATITTIYPGWYQGRAVHIHAKVLLNNNEALTTQLYFDDAVSREVYKTAPYSRRGAYDTSNADDRIYRRDTTLTTAKEGDCYVGRITVGVKA